MKPATRLIFAMVAALAMAGPATAACRQALVLALDVSGSVDHAEYRLQLEGLATALVDPEVQSLLLASPDVPIILSIFEWSGADYQKVILNWTPLSNRATLEQIAGGLLQQQRARASFSTAIGHALNHAITLLDTAPRCFVDTIDISGDGKNNDGPRPKSVMIAAARGNLTVNGLVVGIPAGPDQEMLEQEVAELTSYYKDEVIYGPDAFIESAHGFQDFGRAMKQKLLREVAQIVADAR